MIDYREDDTKKRAESLMAALAFCMICLWLVAGILGSMALIKFSYMYLFR